MKDNIKIWLILGVAIWWVALKEYSPEVLEYIEHVKQSILATKHGGATLWAISATWLTLWGIVIWDMIWKSRERNRNTKIEENLDNKKHSYKLTHNIPDITKNGKLHFRNWIDKHMKLVFDMNLGIANKIKRAAKTMDYHDWCIIIPFEEKDGREVYSSLRDHEEIYPWEDPLQEITDNAHGVQRKWTKFISVLCQTPRYKVHPDGSVRIFEEWDGKADSSAKIRVLTIREELLDKVIKWCEMQEQEHKFVEKEDILDWVCKDINWNCPTVDRYIRYMLKDNERLKNNRTQANSLLTAPVHRRYMVAIAQIARHVKNGWWKVRKFRTVSE